MGTFTQTTAPGALDRFYGTGVYVQRDAQYRTGFPGIALIYQITSDSNPGLNGKAQRPPGNSSSVAFQIDEPLFRGAAMVGARKEIVNSLGGLKAIAISHPHYYTTMTEWSAAFGAIPVYLHAADKKWIMRSAPCLELWRGETKELSPGLTLIRTGGHFEGGTVMHWAQGAGKKGALLSGDLLQVTTDRKFVSFMWSFPNFIPLGAKAVAAIGARLKPWSYDVIYGAFWDRVIASDGRRVTDASVARHLEILQREAD